ncbi:MAG: tetratricopeptide repeat protein, partial [Bacteroidetes bacterium]|nr:tetratricopeptide repeat protein [Bacteroidota bacterium]
MVTPLKVRSSIQRFLFSSGLMLLAFSSYAQKTQIYEQAEETFYHGIELYEKKQYGASIQTFERFLKQDKTDHLLDRQAELYILIGHLQLNHYNADKNLDKELKRGPKTALDNLAIFELGNYYYRTKKFRKAARMYEDLDISNLNKELWAEASFKMGYSFFMSDDYDQAKTHFNNVRNQPGTYYVEANYYYGYICYASKDFDCALKSFKRIEGQGPEIVDLYIAQMYYAEGGYQQALDKCAKSNTEKYPEEYNLLLAKCYFQLEKYAEASKKFAAIDLESELLTTEDIYMIGYSNFLDEKYQDATKAFVKLSGQESALGQLANYQLGQSFIKLDDKQKALNALGVAKRMNFHAEIQEISHYNYARLSYELGAKNSAIQTTQEFIANYPESEYIDDAKGMMADMLVTTNNYTQAIRYLDEIKSFTPRTKDVYQKITYAWAESLFIDGNYEEAKTYFKKSLRFTPNRVKEGQAYYWLGEIAFAKEDYPAAINNYTRMMNNSSASSSRYANFALYNLGYAYYVQKEYSRALNYFLQFQSKSSFSQNREVYADNELRLGDCYFLKKQYDKAKQAYGQVSGGKHPGSDYALYQQGIIYGLLRDPSNKISSLKRIQTDYKSSIYLDDAIYQIAETYLQDLGNPEMAMSMYNLIVNQHENSIYYPAAHVKIGLIFFQKGDNEKALDYFKTVISKFPRTKSSQEAMSWMESVYVKMGKVDEYLDYLASIENGDIRVTYSDSLLYQTTLQKYRTNDCEGAVKGFND